MNWCNFLPYGFGKNAVWLLLILIIHRIFATLFSQRTKAVPSATSEHTLKQKSDTTARSPRKQHQWLRQLQCGRHRKWQLYTFVNNLSWLCFEYWHFPLPLLCLLLWDHYITYHTSVIFLTLKWKLLDNTQSYTSEGSTQWFHRQFGTGLLTLISDFESLSPNHFPPFIKIQQ